jgi:hypothetical protein
MVGAAAETNVVLSIVVDVKTATRKRGKGRMKENSIDFMIFSSKFKK